MKLIVENLAIDRGERRIFSGVNLAIAAGQALVVTGANGAGKSTLLKAIAGFLRPAEGRIALEGAGEAELREHCHYLAHDNALKPSLSVGENLLFAIRAGKSKLADRRQVAEAALDEAGLSGFFERDPATLSGGQKARAALMRVLLSGPRALLLDEPFSKLDTERRAKIRTFVFEEARQRQLPVLLVTHDAADAQAAGGPVVTLG